MNIDSENIINFFLCRIDEVGGHFMRLADIVDYGRTLGTSKIVTAMLNVPRTPISNGSQAAARLWYAAS